MAVEDRQFDRAPLRTDLAQLPCVLEIDGRVVPLQHVNDISVGGVGIRLNFPLPKESTVKLLCDAREQTVLVQGIVAWCHEHVAVADNNGHRNPENFFHSGIRFTAKDTTARTLFYSLLRKHVDLEELCI